jgi:hypothetical protein
MSRPTFRNLVIFLILAFVLTACDSDFRLFKATPKPSSVVKLVENNDGKKDIYNTSHGLNSFDDVSLEQGMAAAQIMCKVQRSISAGSASMLNASPLTLDNCPELSTGVRIQIVNTKTSYSFDCRNCTVDFNGDWEEGRGVRVWRGLVRITRTNDEEPTLYLVPLTQP